MVDINKDNDVRIKTILKKIIDRLLAKETITQAEYNWLLERINKIT